MPSQSTTAFALTVVIIVATAGLVGWYVSSGSSRYWGEGPYYEAIATITEVTDGDTVDVNITDILDPHDGIYEVYDTIRFAGVDAWELLESGGPEAKDFIENLCPVGTTIYMDIDDKAHGNGPYYESYRGNYGRIIAVIYMKVDNNWVNLNAQLVRENHGKAISWFSSEFNSYDWLRDNYPHVLT